MKEQLKVPGDLPLPLPPGAQPDNRPLDDIALEDPMALSEEQGEQTAGLPWAKMFKQTISQYQVGKTTQEIAEQGERGAGRRAAAASPGSMPADAQGNAPIPGTAPMDAPALEPASGSAQVDIPQEELQKTVDSFRPPDEPLDARTKTRNLNIERFESPEEIDNALDEMATREAGFMDARRGVRTHEQTKAAAEKEVKNIIGMSPQAGWTGERILAARNLLGAQASKLQKRAAQLSSPEFSASAEDWTAFAQAQQNFVATQRMVAGATAEIGRALNSMKIAANQPGATRAVQMAELLEKNGGIVNLKQRAKLLAGATDEKDLAALSRRTAGDVTGSVVREIWLSNLLSGPQTHVVNVASNALVQAFEMTAVRPVAVGISSIRRGITKIKGGVADDGMYAGEMAGDAFGFLQGTMDGLAMFAKSIKDPYWSPDGLSKAELQDWHAVSSKNLGVDPESRGGKAVDTIGNWYVRLPFRFLEAEDQLFKSIAYRREINALSYRKARQEGLSGEEVGPRVQELVSSPPEDIHLEARGKAEYTTFTNPSNEAKGGLGQLAHTVQMLSARSTFAKFIIPFVRTPFNLASYAIENSGALAWSNKRWLNDMKAGGAKRDMAMSRFSLGVTTLMAVDKLHDQGMLTGSGPTNKGLKTHLDATGWQENSWLYDGTYYSYNRMDPAGIMVGALADGLDALKYSDTEEEKTMLAVQLALGVANNLTNKTYMQGISQLMTAMNGDYGPVAGASNMVTSSAASLVVPSWLNSIGKATDPEKRISGYQTQPTAEGAWMAFVTKMKARTPWERSDLPSRYDWKGEIIVSDTAGWQDGVVPWSRKQGKRDVATEALLATQVSVSRPSPMIRFFGKGAQVDVRSLDGNTGEVYAKLQEFVGKARYSAVKSKGKVWLGKAAASPTEDANEDLHMLVTKGSIFGKKQFSAWYAEEAKNHPTWMQPGTDEFTRLLVPPAASGAQMMPPHIQAQQTNTNPGDQNNLPGF